MSEKDFLTQARETIEGLAKAADYVAEPSRCSPINAEPCPYCSGGKRTGLPGNACENCMNTGLKYPSVTPAPGDVGKALHEYTNAEISNEWHRRAMDFLGDQRVGVGLDARKAGLSDAYADYAPVTVRSSPAPENWYIGQSSGTGAGDPHVESDGASCQCAACLATRTQEEWPDKDKTSYLRVIPPAPGDVGEIVRELQEAYDNADAGWLADLLLKAKNELAHSSSENANLTLRNSNIEEQRDAHAARLAEAVEDSVPREWSDANVRAAREFKAQLTDALNLLQQRAQAESGAAQAALVDAYNAIITQGENHD